MRTSMFMKYNTWWVPYLYLSVVADGFDGCCASQGALCAAGAELHHSLGPAHQACHSTPVLNQLLLLLLQDRGNHQQSRHVLVSHTVTMIHFTDLFYQFNSCLN